MSANNTGFSRHLEKLVVEIGPRLIGSPANQAAADYIRDTFLSLGLQVEEQPYPCTAWEVRSAKFEADGISLPVEANVFSPACDARGELLALSTIPELETAEIEGKIILFYGELASTQISPKSWFLRGPEDEKIFDLLVSGKPAALVAPPCNSSDYEQVTEDWDLPIPAATLPREVVLELLRQAPIFRSSEAGLCQHPRHRPQHRRPQTLSLPRQSGALRPFRYLPQHPRRA